MSKKNLKGFTLIELMIVVGILGIISAIAIPSYMDYVRKGKRADAKVELLRLAQMQESYFVQNLSYASSLTAATNAGGLGLTAPVQSEQGEYNITIPGANLVPVGCDGQAGGTPCTGYTLTATPAGSQIGDTACLGFTLTNTGARGISPTATDTVRNCWR